MEQPKFTKAQEDAIETLMELKSLATGNADDPDARVQLARSQWLAIAMILAKYNVLDRLVAALLAQAKDLKIEAKVSLFKEIAMDIEFARRREEKQKEKQAGE